MKFQKMIRIQLMLVGLGAGLLLAKPVYAQQDTDPTLFEDTSVASHQDQACFNVPAPPQALKNMKAETTAPSTVQEEDAAVLTSLDVNTILALMVGIGSIVLLGIAEAVRGSRRRTWRVAGSSGFPSSATAN
jgi:hypothetical protein